MRGIDVLRLLKEKGFTEEQVRQWAQRRYPMFASNLELMAYLFLKEHGVEIPTQTITAYQQKKVRELQPNERVVVRVLVGGKIQEGRYYGCPNCFAKVEEEEDEAGNVKYYCRRCNQYVEPRECVFKRYIAGDETGTTVLILPPRLDDIELEAGKLYLIRGRTDSSCNIIVREVKELELPKVPLPQQQQPTEERVVEAEIKVEPEKKEEEIVSVMSREMPPVEIEKPKEEEKPVVKAEAKVEEAKKPLEEQVLEYIKSKGGEGVTASELLARFGDAVVDVLSRLKSEGRIELVKRDTKYYYVAREVLEKKREEKIEVKPVRPTPEEVRVLKRIQSLADLFGGRIELESFKLWLQRTYPQIKPEEFLKKYASILKVRDNAVEIDLDELRKVV